MVTITPGKKCCLIVIDGWGLSTDHSKNYNAHTCAPSDAICIAKTPTMDYLGKEYPNCTLAAHGNAVGLPDGLMGNSEVGHLNLGAGRVVYQDIVRIEMSINDGSMASNAALIDAFKVAMKSNGRLHFIGLLSDGGVHSHINHLKALLKYAKETGVPSSFIHAITDGRDTNPTSATNYLSDIMNYMKMLHYGKIATVMGRYYAMDRDKRWERTKIAFDAMTNGEIGENVKESELLDTIKKRASRKVSPETDEFLHPLIVSMDGLIRDNDVLVFFNFRSDRMRQLVASFGQAPTKFTPNVARPNNIHLTCMTRYSHDFDFPVISPPQRLDNVLTEWLSKYNCRQYHVAETEKYAHVTFFFNGGREAPFPAEDRLMIPSPKVATYDLLPSMSVDQVAEKVADGVRSGLYSFVMCNFAPPDMVGHTGKFEPTVKAIEATDQAIKVVWEACKEKDYALLITADHGNAEKMLDTAGQPHTAHTCSPVPLIVITDKYDDKFPKLELNLPTQRSAALCDVAPTILSIMGLPQPSEMTGTSLL